MQQHLECHAAPDLRLGDLRVQKLPHRFRVSICCLVTLLLIHPTESFVTRRGDNIHDVHRYSSFESRKYSLMATSAVDPAARFHSDMHRVLQSRRNLASNTSLVVVPLERRKRPEVLTTDIDGAERVMSMLRHMVNIGVATGESYHIVLQALANRGRLRWRQEDSLIVCAADEVTVLMHDLWGQLEGTGEITTEICDLALLAYAVCATPRGNREYAHSAQSLLEKMEESKIPITSETLSHVVHAWSWQQENRQSGECARMAQENFDRLLEQSPDAETLQISYHWLLEAWSKSSDEESKERAEKILLNMIKIRKDHPEIDYPNTNSYSNAILAWSKANGEAAASKAHLLMDQAIAAFENGDFPEDSQPELIAFNGVLSAWGRLGRADKAEEVLWNLDRIGQKCSNLVPDVVSYNTVLHAYLRSQDKDLALDRIIAIVKHMEKAVGERPEMKPDSFTHSVLVKAWIQTKRPEAPVRAVENLEKMRKLWNSGDKTVEPSNRHFNIVINALAKSREHVDARKAHALLLQMQTTKGCQPDIISFTSVIECFAKSDDHEAADISVELLRQAASIYEEKKDDRMMPNLRTYSMVISAMTTNPVLDNVLRARELLTELLDLYQETEDDSLRPNAYPFNYALNCAANCVGSAQEKAKAFQVAAHTYNDLRKHDEVQPDSFTYAFWFKCCNNLLPVGKLRTKGVTLAFEQCKADGLVSAETLRRLLTGSPPEMAARLMGLEESTPSSMYRQLTINDLPPSWSRNVRYK